MAKSDKKVSADGQSSAQTELMHRIKEMLPSNISFVEELSDLLGISNDSAYRRIRGETALSIEEIALICKKFKISFDSFINSTDAGMVTFSYKPLSNSAESFKLYLENILSDLKKVQSFDQRQITFAAEDIPVFHHFSQPELASFKIFYWMKSILGVPEFEDKKFEMGVISKDLVETGKKIIDTYNSIPCIEIWSEDTANSTIKQIEYYWDSGVFKSKEDCLMILGQLEKMIGHIRKQAEQTSKFPIDKPSGEFENNYTLYHSDVMIGNNCLLVTTGQVKLAYLSYHTFNAMLTTNNGFINETDGWLKILIRKSIQISGMAEKQRYQFFRRIDETMKRLRDKIEKEG
jgi:hypothetical protein